MVYKNVLFHPVFPPFLQSHVCVPFFSPYDFCNSPPRYLNLLYLCLPMLMFFVAIRLGLCRYCWGCVRSGQQPTGNETIGVWLSGGGSVCFVFGPLGYVISAVTVSSESSFADVGGFPAVVDWLSEIMLMSRISSASLAGMVGKVLLELA